MSTGSLIFDQRFQDDAEGDGVADVDVGISVSNNDKDGGEVAGSLVFTGTVTGKTGS